MNRLDVESVRAQTDLVEVVARYVHLKPQGSRRVGLCPFHAEKTPSFGVHADRQFYKCFGCDARGDVFTFIQEIGNLSFIEALHFLADGRSARAIPRPSAKAYEPVRRGQSTTGTAERTALLFAQWAREHFQCAYDYTDANGKLLYQVVRFHSPKTFMPRYPNDRKPGGWEWKKYPNQELYRLPEILNSSRVFLVEGEKDCEILRDYGFCATTNAGGAEAPWMPQYTAALRSREVILVPDNDPPGLKRGKRIARALLGNVSQLLIWRPEGVKDVAEWFDQGHSELELLESITTQKAVD